MSNGDVKPHIIAVTVENRFGVLARIAGLFSARGYNIDSLCVGETEDPSVSRMTIVVTGDDKVLEQIYKQLNKLVDTVKVQDLSVEECIERELVLMKVHTPTAAARQEIIQLAGVFGAKIVDVGRKSLTIELVGGGAKIRTMIELLRQFGIREMVRTGKIATARETGR